MDMHSSGRVDPEATPTTKVSPQVSVIIPLWRGESVILSCLAAVTTHSGAHLAEVICVDNASPDASAALVTHHFEDVQLLREPVNLGFAGGVNAGLRAATGDVLVLLNQDCIVHPGWLDGLIAALALDERIAIAGCVIYSAAGAVEHAGARLEMPLAVGRHLLQVPEQTTPVDYVTGAVFAMRRTAWPAIGEFDEGFYPAYYEETDYCRRARQHGWEIVVTPDAMATHLASSREWDRDPLLYWANHTRMRYRFVAKQMTRDELLAFFPAETAAAQAEMSPFLAAARIIGARTTLRNLDNILARRQGDLPEPADPVRDRIVAEGFAALQRDAFGVAQTLMANSYPDAPWSRMVDQYLLPAMDRVAGTDLTRRASHRRGIGGRTRLLEWLSAYDCA
ncbi:MAG: glycosyltransferase family 2 protein [Anaerolineales bacterium]|nr:glycosyltransferase family 2 protein [Anaerolineales bacterium]